MSMSKKTHVSRRAALAATAGLSLSAQLGPVTAGADDSAAQVVMIERQTAEVGGLPNQDWSLRVTEVYRRDAEGWELAHRHADPLVHRITIDQASVLAKGSENKGLENKGSEK